MFWNKQTACSGTNGIVKWIIYLELQILKGNMLKE